MRDAPGTLGRLLQNVRPRDGEDRVTIKDLLARIGARSFAPVILLPALMLVSPLSGIPDSPTLGMLLVVTVTAQALIGRGHLWLPSFLMRRTLPARRLTAALDWLAGPIRFLDTHARDRLRFLTVPPLDRVPLLAILCTALPWPLLEPLPFVTSIGATAVSLFAVGLLLRDGLYVVLGFALVGTLGGLALGAYAGLV